MEADYILPDSSTKLLTQSDISDLTLQEFNYAKNEILPAMEENLALRNCRNILIVRAGITALSVRKNLTRIMRIL